MICRSVKVQHYFPPLFFRNTRFRDSRETSVHYSSFSSQNTNTHILRTVNGSRKKTSIIKLLKLMMEKIAGNGSQTVRLLWVLARRRWKVVVMLQGREGAWRKRVSPTHTRNNENHSNCLSWNLIQIKQQFISKQEINVISTGEQWSHISVIVATNSSAVIFV